MKKTIILLVIATAIFLITSCTSKSGRYVGKKNIPDTSVSENKLQNSGEPQEPNPMDQLWNETVSMVDSTVTKFTGGTFHSADYTSVETEDRQYPILRLCKAVGSSLIIEKWTNWSNIRTGNEGLGYLVRRNDDGSFFVETSKTINNQFVDSSEIRIFNIEQLKNALEPFYKRAEQVKQAKYENNGALAEAIQKNG